MTVGPVAEPPGIQREDVLGEVIESVELACAGERPSEVSMASGRQPRVSLLLSPGAPGLPEGRQARVAVPSGVPPALAEAWECPQRGGVVEGELVDEEMVQGDPEVAKIVKVEGRLGQPPPCSGVQRSLILWIEHLDGLVQAAKSAG